MAVYFWWFLQFIEVFLSYFQHFCRRQPSIWVNNDHSFYELSKLWWVSVVYRLKLTFGDIIKQIHETHFFILVSEWRSEFDKFISDAAEGPNIGTRIISLITKKLRRHVKWCTHFRMSLNGLGAELPAEAQITNLQRIILSNKDIGWFQISVHNPFFVHML